MKIQKAIDITMQEMIDIFFSMRADQQQEFLNAIQSSIIDSGNPKKLTAKQRRDQELELFMEGMKRKRRLSADKMTEQLIALLK